jgi:hypothetical protein
VVDVVVSDKDGRQFIMVVLDLVDHRRGQFRRIHDKGLGCGFVAYDIGVGEAID